MHLDDRVPLGLGHVDEHAVAQDAGVVDEHVEAAEGVDGLLHDALGAVAVGDVVAVGDGLAAHGRRSRRRPPAPGRSSAPLAVRSSPPRSLTTTLAPCSASNSACSRPMPRPAPVMMATRPSQSGHGGVLPYSSGMERVAPLPRPWSDEDAREHRRWGHPDATYDPLLLVRCLQRHPRLAARTRALGESLYVDGRLPARDRTLAILRACARSGAPTSGAARPRSGARSPASSEEECDALVTAAAGDARWSAGESAAARRGRRARAHRAPGATTPGRRSATTSTTSSAWSC